MGFVMPDPDPIHPEFHRMLGRPQKEALLRQRAGVIWLYGMSGSGKSTLANALERRLHGEGFFTVLLDGDNVRSGLNRDLGFSKEDRTENLRRIAEVARLFRDNGVVTLVSFITPLESARQQAREILGGSHFLMAYVKADFETCADRDPKGLYARGAKGELPHFTPGGMLFEEPTDPDIMIDTRTSEPEACLDTLYHAILPLIKPDPT